MPINRRNARAREQAELTDHLLPNEQREQLETLYTQMAPAGLKPLWEALAQLVPPHPNSPACAHLWSYGHARDFLMRAGDLISAEQAERRVLILENPGIVGQSAIVPSLYAGQIGRDNVWNPVTNTTLECLILSAKKT